MKDIIDIDEIKEQPLEDIPLFYSSITNNPIPERLRTGNITTNYIKLKEIKDVTVTLDTATLDGMGNVIPYVLTQKFSHNVRSNIPLIFLKFTNLSYNPDVVAIVISDPIVYKESFEMTITSSEIVAEPFQYTFGVLIFELLSNSKID